MSESPATIEPPIEDRVEVESEGHREWSDNTKTQLVRGCRKFRCRQCNEVTPVMINGEALQRWILNHKCVTPQ